MVFNAHNFQQYFSNIVVLESFLLLQYNSLSKTFYGDKVTVLPPDITEDRCFDTWHKKAMPRLEQLGIEVDHAISAGFRDNLFVPACYLQAFSLPLFQQL
jgi:hypothetical protein